MSKPQNSFQTLPQPQKSPIRAQKVNNDPKIKSKSNVRIVRNKENESFSTTGVDPKTVVEPYPNPKKNCPLGPPKVKDYSKIKSKSNIRIERNKENECCSFAWVDPKTVVEPYPNPKNSPLGPKNSRMTTELSKNQRLELKEI